MDRRKEPRAGSEPVDEGGAISVADVRKDVKVYQHSVSDGRCIKCLGSAS